MVIKTLFHSQNTPVSRRMNAVVTDDGTLVQRCLDGDDSAFQCLVSRYQKKLFATAFGMLHHAEDSLDIVQEAFLKVYRYLPKFQGNSSFYTWSYRIVVNLCIDFLRKESRQQTQDYDDAIQQREQKSGEPNLFSCRNNYDPIKAYNNKELGEQIMKAIQTLSGPHRSVIILREIEELSYEEIAQALNCSKGTVMSRLHHARSKLRLALSSYVKHEEQTKKIPNSKVVEAQKEKDSQSSSKGIESSTQ